MGITVLKTSSQAKWDERLSKKEARCPECKTVNSFNIIETQSVGFLGLKSRKRKLYHCHCGCQWATDWN